MPENDNQKTVAKATGAIASVIGVMLSIFALLNVLVPPGHKQSISAVGALLIGLVFTAILVWLGKWTWETALPTWLAMSIGVVIMYLVISRPVTVTGTLVRNDNTPVQNVKLVLSDSGGVPHTCVTDVDGKFVFGKVPEGKYTIAIEGGKVLINNDVPSGLVRFLSVLVPIGQLYIEPDSITMSFPTATPVPTDTPVPVATEPDAELFMAVEQLGPEKFSQPGDIPGAGGNTLIISIPQRSKVVIRTIDVRNRNHHLWMFICIPEQDEANIQCNARELLVSSLGVFNDIVSIGESDEVSKCELLDVGFAIVDNSYSNILNGIPKPMLKSFTYGQLLIEDWYQVKRTLRKDGAVNLSCIGEEARK